MKASLAERIFVPALLLLIFAALSGGFMFGTGGATSRMRIILRYCVLFMAGLLYSMAWHDKLASWVGWDDTWMATSGAVGVCSVFLCRRTLERRGPDSEGE